MKILITRKFIHFYYSKIKKMFVLKKFLDFQILILAFRQSRRAFRSIFASVPVRKGCRSNP